MKPLNNKGAALIMAYSVLSFLVVLSVGLALSTVTELNNARRYRDMTSAFWLAEAGINMFMQDTSVLDGADSKIIPYGEGTIYLTKDDSLLTRRFVQAVGVVRGSERKIQIEYPMSVPDVFNNTVNVKGDIAVTGSKASLLFQEKTRLSGKLRNSAKHSSIFFEDKDENLNNSNVSLTYPDMNNNGVADEFDDFVQFNRKILGSYPTKDVLYIKGGGSYTISPNPSLAGKKIVYVEGNEGGGDVTIQLGGTWGKDQNLTVISTGTVTYNQGGNLGKDAQLNIIAWSGYLETAALPGEHFGMIFTHGTATFDEIHDTSITSGCLVANQGMAMREVWSTKTFRYADTRRDNIVPPGFEGLIGSGSSGYAPTPIHWKEI